ncbi:hypothetical protein EBZ38_13810 [bacterium]|nr:hypothetical protein [bacterium]NDC94956.1 hypothetical protein [bacterium]NDD85334.1 hypothetical protein [bacterium]
MLKANLQILLNQLIQQTKNSLGNTTNIALSEAWKLLQIVIADIIQSIEINNPELKGADKKTLAMGMVSQFYDSVFVIINIPFVPQILQPIIRQYIKSLLMILASSSIDALVTTFRNVGIFNTPSTVDPTIDNIPKISDK